MNDCRHTREVWYSGISYSFCSKWVSVLFLYQISGARTRRTFEAVIVNS